MEIHEKENTEECNTFFYTILDKLLHVIPSLSLLLHYSYQIKALNATHNNKKRHIYMAKEGDRVRYNGSVYVIMLTDNTAELPLLNSHNVFQHDTSLKMQSK